MSSLEQNKSHESAAGHVSGKAVYTNDQRLPAGMLSLYPVLSPHARAKITKLDCTAAYTVAGLVTILTADDIPGENNTGVIIHDEVMLPTEEVSYWGQVIVWAVGETEEAARQGAAKVIVEYEPMDAILSIPEAIASDSYHLDPRTIRRGEPETELQKSEHLLEGELEVGGQDHFYLETHTSWAVPDGENGYQVYSSTQHPSETQVIVARVLGLPNSHVVVTCLRMGGAFGGKESQANPFAAAVAVAAYKTGRPARVSLRRHQDMIISGKRHNFLGKYQVGFTSEGLITALKAELYAEGGWSLDLSPPVLMRAMMHIDNAYYIPHLEVMGRIAKTNRVSNTAYRGFGGPQGMVVCEEIVDRVARALGLPPDVVREKNFYHGTGKTSATHYGQDIVHNRIARVWAEAKEKSNFRDRQVQIAQYNQSSPYK
jgi:xanthine dehydrogenase large subunit